MTTKEMETYIFQREIDINYGSPRKLDAINSAAWGNTCNNIN